MSQARRAEGPKAPRRGPSRERSGDGDYATAPRRLAGSRHGAFTLRFRYVYNEPDVLGAPSAKAFRPWSLVRGCGVRISGIAPRLSIRALRTCLRGLNVFDTIQEDLA